VTGYPPGFVHTPYDGSSKPFTIGMSRLDPKDWIEVDEHLPRYLKEKERLLAEDRDQVFREEIETRGAQAEVLDMLVEYLPVQFPDIYRRDGNVIEIAPANMRIDIADEREAPLLTAHCLVQEDLVLMRNGEGGYRFAAGGVAFPSSWSIADKFGKTLDGLHTPVPGYADLMAGRINRIFDHLKPDQPVQRMGWSLYADDDLTHRAPKPRPENWPGEGAGAFIRLERQTLRRLSTGDILFTIRIHIDPIAALKNHQDGKRLAAGIKTDILGLSDSQLGYRGLARSREAIVRALDAIDDSF
jgi:hypothetical protein